MQATKQKYFDLILSVKSYFFLPSFKKHSRKEIQCHNRQTHILSNTRTQTCTHNFIYYQTHVLNSDRYIHTLHRLKHTHTHTYTYNHTLTNIRHAHNHITQTQTHTLIHSETHTKFRQTHKHTFHRHTNKDTQTKTHRLY